MSRAHHMHRVAALLLVGALGLGGCSTEPGPASAQVDAPATASESPDGPSGTSPAASSDEQQMSRLESAEVSVTVSGAVDVTWTERRDLRIVRLADSDAGINLLSVGLEQMQQLGQREYFRFAFDFVEPYDGPGTYEIQAHEAAAAQSLSSTAFIVWARVADVDAEPLFVASNVEETHDFNQVRQACTLRIGENETEGSLACPELESQDGSTVALEVSWRP